MGTVKSGIILARVPRPVSTLLAGLAVGLFAAGCGGGGGGAGSASTAASNSTGATAGESLPAGCKRVQDPGARAAEAHQPRPKGRLSGPATVVMQTNCGSFTIALAVDQAPKTAASFATLVKRGFYDNLTFHRISGDPTRGPFVIQGGDPLANGEGGPGYAVREKPPADLKYTKYTVAMAKTQTEPAGTSGSQFFVVTARDAGLPPDYALLGRVTAGKDTVDRIAKVPANGLEQPIVPIVIQKATLDGATLKETS
jgi:peptidyl-prolyl cis-trans isomerase B (cyclophilin B)